MFGESDDNYTQSVIVQHSSHQTGLPPDFDSNYEKRMVSNTLIHGQHLIPSLDPPRRKSDSDIRGLQLHASQIDSQPLSPINSCASLPISPRSQPISPISHPISPHSQRLSQSISPNSHYLEKRVCNVSISDNSASDKFPSPYGPTPYTNGDRLDMAGTSHQVKDTNFSRFPRSQHDHYVKAIRKDQVAQRLGRPTTSSGQTPTFPCMICHDRSTGKHYGAYSCDGCKGFFRRSIRKKSSYSCRFSRKCSITKDQRNQCRYCRLQKCIQVGMKKEAVQNERDRITQRKQAPDGVLSIAILINAENQCKQSTLTSNVGEQTDWSNREIAKVSDVAQSVKQQLLVLVEWAKAIPCFTELNLDDRIKLLKAHSGEHLLMGTAWRSRGSDGYLLLGNDKVIPRLGSDKVAQMHEKYPTGSMYPSTDINWIAARILDDVVNPLTINKVDENEFICLRTMIFFDPMLHGLENRQSISSIRLQAQLLLEDYITERQEVEPRGRFGQMMFMLPYLQSIATAMIQQIQYAKLEGMPEIEPLIQEMLLGSLSEENDKEGYAFHPPVVTPAILNASRHGIFCNQPIVEENYQQDQHITAVSSDHKYECPDLKPSTENERCRSYQELPNSKVFYNLKTISESSEYLQLEERNIETGLDLSMSNNRDVHLEKHQNFAPHESINGNANFHNMEECYSRSSTRSVADTSLIVDPITHRKQHYQINHKTASKRFQTTSEPYDLSPSSSISNYSSCTGSPEFGS